MRGAPCFQNFVRACLVCAVGASAIACNDSKGYDEPGPRPQIISISGPQTGAVLCDQEAGDRCALPIQVSFRLPDGEFVWKALVRFQGDGSDDGIDRAYLLPQTVGRGNATDVSVTIDAAVPPTILRTGALFTYSVRLLTGAGEESRPSTLTVSVQKKDVADAGE